MRYEVWGEKVGVAVALSEVGAMSYKRRSAYRLAVELADEVRSDVDHWSSFDRWSIGVQLVRAANSVGANIAEAMGRWHYADQRRLLYVARGSLFETEHWIDRGGARGLLDAERHAERIAQIRRMLNGLIARRRGAGPPFLIPRP